MMDVLGREGASFSFPFADSNKNGSRGWKKQTNLKESYDSEVES